MRFINNAEMAGLVSEGFDLTDITVSNDGQVTTIYSGKSPVQSTNPANQANPKWKIRRTVITELTQVQRTTIEVTWAVGSWANKQKLDYKYL